MRCHWQAFLKILPAWLQEPVDKLGKENMTELRLRTGSAPELVLTDRSVWLTREVTINDIAFCVNAASQYSPWTTSTIRDGYLTAQGGHRIGVCGDVITHHEGQPCLQNITSLCIRVARDFPDIAAALPIDTGSVLIIGPPGSGKTTFLRDLIRQRSNQGRGSVSVVDERGELFPTTRGQSCFATGKRTDVLCGISKERGIYSVIRAMGPAVIAVDEITAKADCDALVHAMWCGVDVLASAHASCAQDLYRRSIYRPLVESNIFNTLIVLQYDKSWRMERIQYDG